MKKMVFTTGATDGLQGLCVYFLALPVVGRPDPTLGFLGSFRIVSGQFDAKSGPSLLSDMSDLIGIVYGPIHSLEQSNFGQQLSSSTRSPSALGMNSMNPSVMNRGGSNNGGSGGGLFVMHSNANNTEAPAIDTTIQEFSVLMRTTSTSMAHVGHVSKLTSAIEEADLSQTSPDRLLRQLNHLLSKMLIVSADNENIDNNSSGSSKSNSNNINESNHSNGGKNGENIDTDNNDKDGSYDDNAELLKWKVIMVKLASAQQQAEEPVFLELLKAVKNSILVKEWEQQLGELRHRLAEAKDNVKYLYAIAEITRPLLSEHPKSLVETMPRIVNSIAWMACISRFFNTPDRLASLFHRLSERVVRSCKKCIYSAWFKSGEHGSATTTNRNSNSTPTSQNNDKPVTSHWNVCVRAQVIESIESCIELAEAFRFSYTETRIGLKRFPSAPQFDFNETYIFGPLDDFLTRAHVLREMLQTLYELFSLGKRGSPLRDETQQVLRRISLLERKYDVEKFDPLDSTRVRGGSNLIHLINAFRTFVSELVSNVKKAIETRLRECTSTRQALKFLAGILSISGLMAQPGMPNSVQDYYSSVVKRYRLELERIAKLYETQKKDPPLRRSIPPVAGHIEWSRQLFRRISEPMQLIQQHDQKNKREEQQALLKFEEGEANRNEDDLSDSKNTTSLDEGDSLLDVDDVPKKKINSFVKRFSQNIQSHCENISKI